MLFWSLGANIMEDKVDAQLTSVIVRVRITLRMPETLSGGDGQRAFGRTIRKRPDVCTRCVGRRTLVSYLVYSKFRLSVETKSMLEVGSTFA